MGAIYYTTMDNRKDISVWDISYTTAGTQKSKIHIILKWKQRSAAFSLLSCELASGCINSVSHIIGYISTILSKIFECWTSIPGDCLNLLCNYIFPPQALLIKIAMFWPPSASPLSSHVFGIQAEMWGDIFSFLSEEFLPNLTFRILMQSDWFYLLLNTSEMKKKELHFLWCSINQCK